MRRGGSLVTCLRSHGYSLSVWRFAPSSSGHIMQLVSPPKTWRGYWCISGRRMFSIFERWTSVLRAYTETSKVGGPPGRGENGRCQQPFRVEAWDGGNETREPGGVDQNGPVFASGVFVLADVRNNGGFSARAVGVYVGEGGGVVDFLEEEDVEVVFEVSENLAAHYRLLLQVVGQEKQF